ncbi:MAG: TrbI/VirB10 family protein [Rickettsiales bacterium]
MADTPPPPPPPENPFASAGDTDPFALPPENEGLGQGTPSVAARPGRVLAVLAMVAAALLFLLYNIFFSSKPNEEDLKPKERTVVAQPMEPPELPRDPAPIAPPVGILPPEIPKPAEIQILKPQDDGTAKAEADARLRSKMLVVDGSGSALGDALGGGDDKSASADANSQFADNIARGNTKAERVLATHIGDLRRTIAQGRIIQATMESALNTDLPAPIRAIVSRDTFAEAGTVALIPKGSRLIGEYNTQLSGGQSRVFVVWTRVIRPDGIDVLLNSPLVDQIGQAGVAGQVDTKFQAIFSRAVLSSVVSIAFASLSDTINGSGQTSTTNSNVGTTQSGDGATTATVNALNRLGSTTDGFLQRLVDVRPTILVDQGTPVNVFVNRDLVFPSDVAGTRVIN